jgi:mRNA interferase RelE/StbE
MTPFSIAFKPSVEKDLRPLPNDLVTKIIGRIESLADEPFPRQAIKLGGAEHVYRLRVGDYRVIYKVDVHARQVIVHHVRHRSEAYRQS